MAQLLATAGDILRSAVNQYVQACSVVRDACRSGGRLNSDPELVKSLEKESNDIVTQIRRLEAARAAVDAARSSIPKVSHNTALPAEILARIFSLVLPGQTCIVQRGYSGSISGVKYCLYPDALAHVCSFWRCVAITTPILWTHIDIALDHSLNPSLFARAKVYAARAGHFPLEVHISDPGSTRERTRPRDARVADGTVRKPLYEWDDLHDFKFLPFDTAPIKSLEMDLFVERRFREAYYSVLEHVFARCQPGVLTEYTVRVPEFNWAISRLFLEPAETPYSQDGALLAVPSLHLEELWLRIPIIRVNGLCPHWKSKAYHGLVELYIGEGIPEISELQLAHILKACPELQVLHFNTPLDEFNEGDESIGPVYLEDLRELKLMIRGDDEISISSILRLIAPGSKPLNLALTYIPDDGTLGSFRANITRFFVRFPINLNDVLDKCSRLEVLVMDERDLDTQDLSALIDLDENLDGEGALPSRPISPSTCRVDALYLLGYQILVFEQVQAVIEKYSVQKLIIYCGVLSYQTGEGRTLCENLRNIKVKLSTITTCPSIEYHPDEYSGQYSDDEMSNLDGWIRNASRL